MVRASIVSQQARSAFPRSARRVKRPPSQVPDPDTELKPFLDPTPSDAPCCRSRRAQRESELLSERGRAKREGRTLEIVAATRRAGIDQGSRSVVAEDRLGAQSARCPASRPPQPRCPSGIGRRHGDVRRSGDPLGLTSSRISLGYRRRSRHLASSVAARMSARGFRPHWAAPARPVSSTHSRLLPRARVHR